MSRERDPPTYPADVGDWTSLTVDELTALVPPLEGAFLAAGESAMVRQPLNGCHNIPSSRSSTERGLPGGPRAHSPVARPTPT